LDGEPVARLELAVHHQPRTRRVLLGQPGLIEEGRLHRAGVIGDGRLDEWAHATAPHRTRGDGAHLHDDGGGLARDQLRHRAGLAPVARQVLEQVPNRAQSECGGGLLGLGAVELQPPRQLRRARVVHGRRDELGFLELTGAGKRGRGHGSREMMTAPAVSAPDYSAASSHQ
jgi:hypothetical protein